MLALGECDVILFFRVFGPGEEKNYWQEIITEASPAE